MKWAVVNTDNFGRDYPNEKFVGEPLDSQSEAQVYADKLNCGHGEFSERYHKVVQLPYKLQPGFEL